MGEYFPMYSISLCTVFIKENVPITNLILNFTEKLSLKIWYLNNDFLKNNWIHKFFPCAWYVLYM